MATSGVGISPCSDLKSSEVSEEESLAFSMSDSEELSELVDGAYSCFNGEDVRRFADLSKGLGVAFNSGVGLLFDLGSKATGVL